MTVGLERRNARVVQLRAEGMTLRAIGDVFGLKPERVRQIPNQARRPPRPDRFPELALPDARTINVLERAGYRSTAQVAATPDAELRELPGCGPKTLAILTRALKEAGYARTEGGAQ